MGAVDGRTWLEHLSPPSAGGSWRRPGRAHRRPQRQRPRDLPREPRRGPGDDRLPHRRRRQAPGPHPQPRGLLPGRRHRAGRRDRVERARQGPGSRGRRRRRGPRRRSTPAAAGPWGTSSTGSDPAHRGHRPAHLEPTTSAPTAPGGGPSRRCRMALVPIGGEPLDDDRRQRRSHPIRPSTWPEAARRDQWRLAVVFRRGRPVGVVTEDALAEAGTTSQQDAPISTVMDYVAVRVTRDEGLTRPCGPSPTPRGTGSKLRDGAPCVPPPVLTVGRSGLDELFESIRIRPSPPRREDVDAAARLLAVAQRPCKADDIARQARRARRARRRTPPVR